jgi:acyl-CoA thioesterase-2
LEAPTDALVKLLHLLDVRKLNESTFCGESQDLGFRQLFGGHVLAQALMAASKTVERDRFCHSLHAYFLRLGKTNEPVFYEVQRTRNGHSFSTRTVLAVQSNTTIFTMLASFHRPEKGPCHQVDALPDVPGPEGLKSEVERLREIQDHIPAAYRENLTADRPIEIRVVDPVDFLKPQPKPALKNSWFRANGKILLKDSDDANSFQPIHQALLAYASDFGLASTAGLPHGLTFFKPGIQIASLDHSIWFHQSANLDDWMLYSKDGPVAGGARGFNRGRIFTRSGKLVASVAQESLIRTAST